MPTGRDVSITIFTASSLNSGEKLFFGRGNYFTFPDIHRNGWTVRKPRGQGRAAARRPPGGVRGKLLAADEHYQAAPLNDCLRDSDEYRAIIRNLLHLGKISYGLARSPSPSTLPRRSGSPAPSVPEF